MFNSFRGRNKLYTANIQTLTQTDSSGVLGPKVWTDSKTIDCLFWKGGASDRQLSDKQRAEVQAFICIDPADVSASAIPDSARVQVKSGTTIIGTYSIINADDIGLQNKIIIIPLKEFK